MPRILVYWVGIIGIPGKGPAHMESYDPNRRIGDLIHTMANAGVGERHKRIEILKFNKGNINSYDRNDPYWNHNSTLSDYVMYMGGLHGNDISLIFCLVQ